MENKKIRIVTSFSKEGYEQYAQRMLESTSKYWPGEIYAYVEGLVKRRPGMRMDQYETYDNLPNVTYKDLNRVEHCAEFLSATSYFPVMSGIIGEKRNYRFDIYHFSRKMFAILDAAKDFNGLLFWLDADTVTLEPIRPEWIYGLFDDGTHREAFMTYMGRAEWHSCASFLGFDCSSPYASMFFQMTEDLLLTGQFLLMDEWHDSYLFDQLRTVGVPAVNLAEGYDVKGPANVFNYVFAGKALHMKGNLKKGPQRYNQLIEIAARRQPDVVIEVGTWNGQRASQLHDAVPHMEYIGLDLFEQATPEIDAAEKNVKPHFTAQSVADALGKLGVKATLVQGNTRETFPQVVAMVGLKKADLIYIDAGHSVETINQDLSNALKVVSPHGVIVLDDYYTDMPKEHIDQFGCNRVLEASGLKYSVLPIKDPVVDGGMVQMAVIYMDDSIPS